MAHQLHFRSFLTNKKRLIIILSVFILASCNKNSQNQIPPPKVIVTDVIQKDVVLKDEFVGQINGYKDIAIRARVDGYLTGIHFEEGFPVKEGQLLYTIDPQPFQAKVAEAMGRVAEAKTRMTQAKNDLERYRPLAEINAVSKKDFDAAEANFGAAKAAVEAAEASLSSANIQLGYTRIKAPISGIIGKSMAKTGDYVGVAPNPVVLNEVSRIDTVLVEFSIPESKYLELMNYDFIKNDSQRRPKDKQQKLELILSDGSIHSEAGRINFINRQVDPTTGTILIQASFFNPRKVLRPGQFAKVRGAVENVPGALLVPQKSVVEVQGNYNVYLVNDSSKAVYRSIEIGRAVDDMWLVKKGLQKSDKVIYEGLMKIRDGVVVNPEERPFVSVIDKTK